MSITFHSKVAMVTGFGSHIRYVPGALAQALVVGGAAAPQPGAGKVRAVAITRPASTHALRIGDATGRATGVRFYRVEALPESGAMIYQHHPRCLEQEPDPDA
jgi:hypothetical protein